MLVNTLRTFEHKVFHSMVDNNDPQVIPDFSAQSIKNTDIRNLGELAIRDGLTARGSSPSQTNIGSIVIKRADGTNKLLRVIDGAGNTAKFQHSDDGSTWSDVSGGTLRTTGAVWRFVQANNNVYGVNGIDTPIKYDSGTVSTVAAIPQGIAIEWWKNFLWVFGNPTFKDRLYFSVAATPETFNASDYINVNLGDVSQGIGIKGVGGATGRLYLGKERSWWFVTGTSSVDFALNPLTYEFGCASHESIVQVQNGIWAMDQEGNVRVLYRTIYDVPMGSLASKDITTTTAGLNRSQLSKSSAVWYNNYALFFVPNAVDSTNSLVLVFDTLCNEKKGGWGLYTNWNIARANVFQNSLFLFDARSGNGQTYQWTGTSDNGQQITATYETKVYDFGFPAQQKHYSYSYQFGNIVGNFTSGFYCSIDRYYYVKLASPSLAGTGNKLLGSTWMLGVDKLGSGGFVKIKIPFTANGGANKGTTMQVKIELMSATTKLKVRNFTSHYRVYGLH